MPNRSLAFAVLALAAFGLLCLIAGVDEGWA